MKSTFYGKTWKIQVQAPPLPDWVSSLSFSVCICIYHTSLGDDLPSQSHQGPQPNRKQPSFLILPGVMMTQDSLFTFTSGLYKLPLCHFMPNPLAKKMHIAMLWSLMTGTVLRALWRTVSSVRVLMSAKTKFSLSFFLDWYYFFHGLFLYLCE